MTDLECFDMQLLEENYIGEGKVKELVTSHSVLMCSWICKVQFLVHKCLFLMLVILGSQSQKYVYPIVIKEDR